MADRRRPSHQVPPQRRHAVHSRCGADHDLIISRRSAAEPGPLRVRWSIAESRTGAEFQTTTFDCKLKAKSDQPVLPVLNRLMSLFSLLSNSWQTMAYI